MDDQFGPVRRSGAARVHKPRVAKQRVESADHDSAGGRSCSPPGAANIGVAILPTDTELSEVPSKAVRVLLATRKDVVQTRTRAINPSKHSSSTPPKQYGANCVHSKLVR